MDPQRKWEIRPRPDGYFSVGYERDGAWVEITKRFDVYAAQIAMRYYQGEPAHEQPARK